MRKLSTLAIASVLAMLLVVGAVAPAAAQTTTTDTSPLIDQSVTVDDSTRAISVSASDSTAVLDVTIYSVVNGTETQVTTGTIDATNATTGTFEWSLPSDPAGEYRVVLDGGDAASTNLVTVEEQAVGGGVITGDSIPISNEQLFAGALVLLLLGAGLFVYDQG